MKRLVRWSLTPLGYAAMVVAFLILNAAGYLYAGGLDFVQGWGGGFAAVIATYYLVFKSSGYWTWMIVNAGLWTYLFFHVGLPMLAWLQISFLFLSVYGAVQWALVKWEIGFRLNRRSDIVGSILASAVFVYSVVAYLGMDGYAGTSWWWVEFGSVATAIAAIWMDAFRYKGNWIAWTLSNCCSAPLFLHGRLWGPLLTIPLYQALNVIGYIRWYREEKAMRRHVYAAVDVAQPDKAILYTVEDGVTTILDPVGTERYDTPVGGPIRDGLGSSIREGIGSSIHEGLGGVTRR